MSPERPGDTPRSYISYCLRRSIKIPVAGILAECKMGANNASPGDPIFASDHKAVSVVLQVLSGTDGNPRATDTPSMLH